MIDVVYLAFNRLDYVKVTFPLLLKNTDWSLVDRLLIYEDGSTDGTREYLDDQVHRGRVYLDDQTGEFRPIEMSLSFLGYGSPVATMRHYVGKDDARDLFAKIDNDIAVPPGWLNALSSVADASPELQLLGMQIGFGGDPPDGWDGRYGYLPSPHIGGVGLMRTAAFRDCREPLMPAGRFGFTRWQYRNDPVRGWVTPDVVCPQMDLLPVPPWPDVAARYRTEGWQREWPPYDETSTAFWDWIGL